MVTVYFVLTKIPYTWKNPDIICSPTNVYLCPTLICNTTAVRYYAAMSRGNGFQPLVFMEFSKHLVHDYKRERGSSLSHFSLLIKYH